VLAGSTLIATGAQGFQRRDYLAWYQAKPE